MLHRLCVVTEAVRAHAGAAQRVAGTALIAQPGEDATGLEVEIDGVRVIVLFGPLVAVWLGWHLGQTAAAATVAEAATAGT